MAAGLSKGLMFRRRKLLLREEQAAATTSPKRQDAVSKFTSPHLAAASSLAANREDRTVLIVNASHEMAHEITSQLTLAMPWCSILYAPSIELAKLLLKRRKISLVVSSPILPDGHIFRLKDTLETMTEPPDVVVVGDMSIRSAEILSDSKYHFASLRMLGKTASRPQGPPKAQEPPVLRQPRVQETITSLGADLRNDLNNPLQEIVAMVFVARTGGEASNVAQQALDAIDKAAQNMAHVVSQLEGKIRDAVSPTVTRG